MCVDPVTALTVGSTVVGMAGQFMNTQAQNKQAARVVRAREEATRQEIARQNALRDEATQAYQSAQPKMSPENDTQQRQQAADERVAEIARTAPTTGAAPTALPTGAPAQVQDEVTRRMRMATEQAQEEARRRAAVSSYDSALFDRNLAAQRTGSQIDMYNNFSRGFGSIFPAQLQAAENNVYRKGLPIWGDLLSTAGRVGTAYFSSRPVSSGSAFQTFANPAFSRNNMQYFS